MICSDIDAIGQELLVPPPSLQRVWPPSRYAWPRVPCVSHAVVDDRIYSSGSKK